MGLSNKKQLGVEIEFTGVSRVVVVRALENLFHTTAKPVKSKSAEDGYTYYKIPDEAGNFWTVMRDRSIKPQKYQRGSDFKVLDIPKDIGYGKSYMVELVSPILTSETLPTLFTVVSVIKSLGGLVNETCGIHVHIDRLPVEDMVSLMRRFLLEQENIFNSFYVTDFRRESYCKPYKAELSIPDFNTEVEFLFWLWENCRDLEKDGYTDVSSSRSLRYYALNFYSLVSHGTVEYRLFNSTLDRVELAKILKWVLGFSYPCSKCTEYQAVLEGILVNEIKAVGCVGI